MRDLDRTGKKRGTRAEARNPEKRRTPESRRILKPKGKALS